jgi:outer membrane receptor protein involved in Fe transport
VTDYNGNPLPNAPRFKVSGTLSYEFEISKIGTITPRYDVTWSDDVFFDPSAGRGAPDVNGETFLPANTIGQEALFLHNFVLSYAVEGEGIEISGWVRNMTNETYKTLAFDASAGPGLIGNLVGDPRTYGFSTKFSF